MCEDYEIINSNIVLPDHTLELDAANILLEKYKIITKSFATTNAITNVQHLELYEKIIRVLDYVGRLSMPVFEINEEMETLYFIKYPQSPELAKKLWLEHYGILHNPYNLIKNRSFTALDNLDNLYFKCNGKHPDNWKC